MPSGAGKIYISKFVSEQFLKEVIDIETFYVNCWRNYTRFRRLYRIFDDLGATIDIRRHVDHLQQHDGP